MVAREMLVGMSRDTANSQNNAGMLDRIVWVIKHCADRPRILTLCEHQHLLQPIRSNDLDIIIQKKNIFAMGTLRAKIIDRREVEFARPGHHPEAAVLLNFLVIRKCFFFGAVILNNDDFPIAICGLLDYRIQALFQILNMVFIWNQDGNQRLSLNLIRNSICGRNLSIKNGSFQPGPLQMLRQGFLCSIQCIWLCRNY